MEKSTYWRTIIGMFIGSLLLMLIPKVGIILGLFGLVFIGYYGLMGYYYHLNPEYFQYRSRSPYGIPGFFFNT